MESTILSPPQRNNNFLSLKANGKLLEQYFSDFNVRKTNRDLVKNADSDAGGLGGIESVHF